MKTNHERKATQRFACLSSHWIKHVLKTYEYGHVFRRSQRTRQKLSSLLRKKNYSILGFII